MMSAGIVVDEESKRYFIGQFSAIATCTHKLVVQNAESNGRKSRHSQGANVS